ncbi:MAG: YHS domain-containing protein [Pseudomonadota bacterium]
MAQDPVCKMEVEPARAAATAQHAGHTYYFCSEACRKTFAAAPEKYAAAPHGSHGHGGDSHSHS